MINVVAIILSIAFTLSYLGWSAAYRENRRLHRLLAEERQRARLIQQDADDYRDLVVRSQAQAEKLLSAVHKWEKIHEDAEARHAQEQAQNLMAYVQSARPSHYWPN